MPMRCLTLEKDENISGVFFPGLLSSSIPRTLLSPCPGGITLLSLLASRLFAFPPNSEPNPPPKLDWLDSCDASEILATFLLLAFILDNTGELGKWKFVSSPSSKLSSRRQRLSTLSPVPFSLLLLFSREPSFSGPLERLSPKPKRSIVSSLG